MSNTLIVIGGGAAGIMAAISAKISHPDIQVTILDRTTALGRKILVCGAGRCNVTNVNVNVNRYYGNTKFISSIISQFNGQDIVKFFNKLGVELYEEEKNGRKKGKIFPVTNQAATITELLSNELERLKVDVVLNTEVVKVAFDNNKFNVLTNDKDYQSDFLIISAGGKTYPALGSNGTGYAIAESFGHTIIKPVPSALPLETNNELIKKIAGIKLPAEVTSIIDDKVIKTDTDEVMFTPYGVSGPAILNISRDVSIRINREEKHDCKVRINMMPGKNYDSFFTLMNERWKRRPDQQVLYSLYGLFPNKIPQAALEYLKIRSEKLNSKLSAEDKKLIVSLFTNWELEIQNTRSWNEGEFTAGGINTKEIKDHTLESKIIPHLYFAGEIINVDGDVGGFNLSWAWASGNVAGRLV